MIFTHRAVSLLVIGSVAVFGGNSSGAGSSVASAAAASADQHNHHKHNHNIVYQRSMKEQTQTTTTTRARRAKKSKGGDALNNRAAGGIATKSTKNTNAMTQGNALNNAGADGTSDESATIVTSPIENKIYGEEILVLPLEVNRNDTDGTETVVSTVGEEEDEEEDEEEEVEHKAIDMWNFYMHYVPEDKQQPRGQEEGGNDGDLKATDQFSFNTEHNENKGVGNIKARIGDIPVGPKPIDDALIYEDYVPDEGVGLDSNDMEEEDEESDASLRTIVMDPASVTSTPTVSPTTSAPTMKPTNSPIVPPPPLPTNAPIVPPKAEYTCFEENGVKICVAYYPDLSCDMIVDGMTCNCCRYDSAVGFVSTFDCTNIGDEWGQMGLCEPGPMPVQEDKKKKDAGTIEEDFILSLEYGDDGDGDDPIASFGTRQRRGRRRAQVVRRKTAATKKRREAMTM